MQDPEIMQVWTEFIEIFQNKFFQPFMIATLATLQEYEPQIEAQGEKMEKIFSKVVNRTGDAVSDAFGNVIAGIPYIGTVVAGIGAADNLAKVIITICRIIKCSLINNLTIIKFINNITIFNGI